MKPLVERAEKVIVGALMVALLIMVLAGTVGVFVALFQHLTAPPYLFADSDGLFSIFGLVVVILVGIELLRILLLFLHDHAVDPAIVVEVAIIALCNKLLVSNLKEMGWPVLVGLAALLAGLALAFTALRRSPPLEGPPDSSG